MQGRFRANSRKIMGTKGMTIIWARGWPCFNLKKDGRVAISRLTRPLLYRPCYLTVALCLDQRVNGALVLDRLVTQAKVRTGTPASSPISPGKMYMSVKVNGLSPSLSNKLRLTSLFLEGGCPRRRADLANPRLQAPGLRTPLMMRGPAVGKAAGLER